jgi:hypothetical protein
MTLAIQTDNLGDLWNRPHTPTSESWRDRHILTKTGLLTFALDLNQYQAYSNAFMQSLMIAVEMIMMAKSNGLGAKYFQMKRTIAEYNTRKAPKDSLVLHPECLQTAGQTGAS